MLCALSELNGQLTTELLKSCQTSSLPVFVIQLSMFQLLALHQTSMVVLKK